MTEPGFAVWVTGPDPVPVHDLAHALAGRLTGRGLPVELLDADTPGIDAAGANAVGAVAGALARHGVITVVALPGARHVRDRARTDVERMIEVYVHRGETIPASPHDAPERAEVEIVVPESTPGAGVERTLHTLELLRLLPPESRYSEAEERDVIRRLKAFGYL